MCMWIWSVCIIVVCTAVVNRGRSLFLCSVCLQYVTLLDENDQLVRCIAEYMQKGRAAECVQYQQILHRNIIYLGTIADASPDLPTDPAPCDSGEKSS